MKREPSDAALYAARLARAFPSLSTYSSACLAEELCLIERAQRRHAERCCNGADGGYVRRPGVINAYGVVEHDPIAERRADDRIRRQLARWRRELFEHAGPAALPVEMVKLEYDPRGRVLLLHLPGEEEPS